MIQVTRIMMERGLEALGLSGKTVEVHASLSSFGSVIGGARAVVDGLLTVCDTILMPVYSFDNYQVRPPENDRPQQNGINYNGFDEKTQKYVNTAYPFMSFQPDLLPDGVKTWFIDFRSRMRALCTSSALLGCLIDRLMRIPMVRSINNLAITPFNPDSFGNNSYVNGDMGQIAKVLLGTQGTIRSRHPTVSWAANGSRAKYLMVPHPADDPLAPLRKLFEDRGHILLLGVPLAKCTALHLAEAAIGRRTFIRWVLYADGIVRRVRQNGCIGGAINLDTSLKTFAKQLVIGSCIATTYPIRELVETGAQLMQANPKITLCSEGRGCVECIDASKGGALE